MSESASPSPTPAPPRENLLVNLACNVFLPGLVLDKLSKTERLGPLWALVVAVALPLGYGLWDWSRRREWSFISTLGIVGTLASGGLGVGTHLGWWRATALWYAVKEASIPVLIGIALPVSARFGRPLVRTLLYNDQVLDTGKVAAALRDRGTEAEFRSLLSSASWLLTLSFLISAALNFGLAVWILKAEPGSEEWNRQLGRMAWLSWPVIVVPSMAMMVWALFRLLNGIQRLTGLRQDELFRTQPSKPLP